MDYYSRNGADALAKMINRFWREHGYTSVKAERFLVMDVPGVHGIYGVRSNLVNGNPPKP